VEVHASTEEVSRGVEAAGGAPGEAREQERGVSSNATVTRIGLRLGVNADTLRTWCKQAEIEAGRVLADGDVDAIAAEVETGEFDVEVLKSRRRVRPMIGAAPAEVVPVRIDPELRAAINAHAVADETMASDVIREALRRYLEVA